MSRLGNSNFRKEIGIRARVRELVIEEHRSCGTFKELTQADILRNIKSDSMLTGENIHIICRTQKMVVIKIYVKRTKALQQQNFVCQAQ